MAFVKTKFTLPTVTRKDGTLGAYVQYNSNPRGDQFIWPAQRIAILLAKQKAAGKKAPVRQQVPLGSVWSWWTSLIGAQPIQVPLTPQEQQDLTNAAVRAHGIDPNTNKLIAPQYSGAVAGQLKIDPNDSDALKAAADKVRAAEAARIAADFARLKAEQEAGAGGVAIPWGKVLLVGGGVVLGTVVLVKLAK